LKSVRETHGMTTTDFVTGATEEPAPDGHGDNGAQDDVPARDGEVRA
jgi:hypothetical protein